jgi:hypothetical protein
MEEGYKYDQMSIRGESLIMKIARLIAILMFVGTMLLIFSCNKKDNDEDTETLQGNGMVDVQLQKQAIEDPSDYIAMNIDIQEVQLHYTGDLEQEPTDNSAGWVALRTNIGIYDILDLENNVSAVICRQDGIQGRKINGMRLVLGTRNSLVIRSEHGDTVTYPMVVPSGSTSGLKINLSTKVLPNKRLVMLVEMDTHHSVTQAQGPTTYNLNPVIKLKNITYR